MTREEPESLTDIRDFTTLFYMSLIRKSSEWLEWYIGSDLDMRFVIWYLDLAICVFAFFKHCFLCNSSLLKRVSYLLIFVIWEKEMFIFVIHDPLLYFFRL